MGEPKVCLLRVFEPSLNYVLSTSSLGGGVDSSPGVESALPHYLLEQPQIQSGIFLSKPEPGGCSSDAGFNSHIF